MNLQKIFSIKNDQNYKVLNLFGYTFKLKKLGEPKDFFNLYTQRLINAAEVERSLLLPMRFKNFVFDNNDIKFQNLIKNLDEQSIQTVIKILKRIEIELQYDNKVGIDKKIYTQDELEKIEKLKKEFCYKIDKKYNKSVWNKYQLPKDEFAPSVFYYKLGLDEVTTLDIIKSKNIIDAGAYIGDSAIVLSDYTDKKVYSFEPFKKNFKLLKKTIKMNKKKNIVPIDKALGSETKMCSMVCETTDLASSKVYEQNNKNTIKMTSIDEFVKQNNIQVGLIKADLEGFEQNMLKGAINTIKEQKPTLIICIYHSLDDFFNIKPMIENLNLGYKFKIYKPCEYTVTLETVLIAEAE